MKQTSKSKPARKTGAKKAARPKAASARAKAKPKAQAKARAKAPAPRKAAKARKPAAKKRGAAKKSTARKTRPAKPGSIERASATGFGTSAGSDPDLESPALAALEAAISGQAPDQPDKADGDTLSAERLDADGDAGPDSGEASEDTPARVNKLVPTNAVHTTKRRMKRNTWQGPVLALGAVAAMLALVVMGQERTPPDVSPLEQRASVDISDSPLLSTEIPSATDPVQAAPDPAPEVSRPPKVPSWRDKPAESQQARAGNPMHGLKVLELVELERLLQKMDMNPSRPDGIVDSQTEEAIRMYQQIAGLPIDGEPSRELLNDMREVAKMLDGEG